MKSKTFILQYEAKIEMYSLFFDSLLWAFNRTLKKKNYKSYKKTLKSLATF